jgi:hypothetical protein
MEKLLINIHSFVDVITNSSTELFVCETDKALDVVKSLVYDLESKYPNEYGHKLMVDVAEDYELQDAFGYIDEEEAIKYLKAKGYKIEEPNEDSAAYISISAERGGLDPRVKEFIEKTFNVIHYTTEA